MNNTETLAAVVATALADAGLTGPDAHRTFTVADIEAVATLTRTSVSELIARIEPTA